MGLSNLSGPFLISERNSISKVLLTQREGGSKKPVGATACLSAGRLAGSTRTDIDLRAVSNPGHLH